MRAKNTFPGIPRKTKRDPTQDAISESVEVLTGQRGNGDNRALLLKDLINLDALKRAQLIKSAQGVNNGGLPIDVIGGIELPHAPVNLTGIGGFTFIALTWDHPTYRGHAYAEIYRGDTNVFADAIKISTEVTDIFSDIVNMGVGYYYWVRFVNDADAIGPTQGANGLYVETQESASLILDKIGGLIEKSHLGEFLSLEINQINVDLYEPLGLLDLVNTNVQEVKDYSEALSIDLVSNYYNIEGVNGAISLADTNLKSTIENPAGSSIGAMLNNFYYTAASVDAAIASAGIALKAEIENPAGGGIEADFILNYLTKVDTLQAISQSVNQLSASFEVIADTMMENALANDLVDQSHRKVSADIIQVQKVAATEAEATAEDVLQLNSNIGDVSANLQQNYYTKVTANSAISQADLLLKSTIESPWGGSVGASLYQLSQTVATNDEQWAMWAVKTTVNGLTSSFGLVNDGSEPIFAIKGAKFAVITSQDPNNLTPVFAVSNGKTVIKNALIDDAYIKTLVTDDVLAGRLIVGSSLKSPSINYNPDTGARSNNFSIDSGGNMQAKSAVLQSVTITDEQGNVVFNSSGGVNASQVSGLGAFSGLDKILATNVTTYIASGSIGVAQIDQAYIAQLFGINATFSGEVFAEKITGDLIDGDVVSVSASAASVSTSWSTIKSILVQRNVKYDVWLTVNDLIPDFYSVAGFGALYTQLRYGAQTGKAVLIPKGASLVTIAIQVKKSELINSEVPVDTNVPTQNAILQMFRKGSGFIV